MSPSSWCRQRSRFAPSARILALLAIEDKFQVSPEEWFHPHWNCFTVHAKDLACDLVTLRCVLGLMLRRIGTVPCSRTSMLVLRGGVV